MACRPCLPRETLQLAPCTINHRAACAAHSIPFRVLGFRVYAGKSKIQTGCCLTISHNVQGFSGGDVRGNGKIRDHSTPKLDTETSLRLRAYISWAFSGFRAWGLGFRALIHTQNILEASASWRTCTGEGKSSECEGLGHWTSINQPSRPTPLLQG